MLDRFHPAVARWFREHFAAPTEPQLGAWPAILEGQHVLIAAPTGSGKTLAAFLAAIDTLVRQAVAGALQDATQVVYVSPLKALSNDVQKNLQLPLAGVAAALTQMELPAGEIRALVRTGDTDPADRAAMRRRPPHILVTTPESLYLLLTSASGRRMLSSTRSVIVDEIHAVAGSKRGSHLALSLERLAGLCTHPLQRIGLSATQKPIEEVASFLVGAGAPGCTIIDSGHVRTRDLALVLPDAPLEAVMSGEVWENLYGRLAELVDAHKTTLVFANTRRMVERVTRHLSERLGENAVAAHHGSLSKEQRLDAEQRLKHGRLKALVATASLELGIDIGDVDLVCQLGTPRSIAAFLQRVGRANHAITGVPKGRLFPLSRDDLVECAALLEAVERGELDRLKIPQRPLDVLAQQLVAEVSAREYGEEELYERVCRAWPYRALARADFDAVVRVLTEGFSTRRGRRSAYLHRDAVNRRLRPRKGARLAAVTCGGAIPDNADYQVVLEPAGTFIGTLNEDFAIESMAGDIFQLGNSAYRILRVEAGKVRVEDAKGLPPTLPFWLGEAPARTDELSAAVSRLRAEVDLALAGMALALQPAPESAASLPPHSLPKTPASGEPVAEEFAAELPLPQGPVPDGLSAQTPLAADPAVEAAIVDLMKRRQLSRPAAEQIVEYLAVAKAMLGELPTQEALVFERFFDETGGMQLVIHAPFGARINKAFGLALRKRFCRAFNFELQAAASEDAIVLSLGETHSFALEEVARYLNSRSVREVLVQAVLDAPLFTTRWRWNATISLAVRRAQGGRRTPAPLQRIYAEDLMAVVFPDQLACAENLSGEREIPDHPLVKQTLEDCLHEAMDVAGLETLLAAVERGEKRILTRDLPHPSPLAQEILNARPYAFLDDAPLEERRTQAVAARRWLDPKSAEEFGRLDPAAIAAVREEAWPAVDTPDELHDALMSLGLLTAAEGERAGWQPQLESLIAERRATRCLLPNGATSAAAPNEPTAAAGPPAADVASIVFWAAAEQLALLKCLYPGLRLDPPIDAPTQWAARAWSPETAAVELIRNRVQGLGPVTAAALADSLHLAPGAVEQALMALENEGFVLRGQFAGQTTETEWCERRLLARIHRYTIRTLRAEIEPVSAADFMRFLLEWQGLTREPRPQGIEALAAVVEQLEGYETAAAAWEPDVLASRLKDYDRAWLDTLCLAGRVMWARLSLPKTAAGAPVRATPIALLTRKNWPLWQALTPRPAAPRAEPADVRPLSHAAQTLATFLQTHGASFFDELLAGAGLLRAQVEDGLGELVAAGLASADSFNGLRALLVPTDQKRRVAAQRRFITQFGLENAGRWSLMRREPAASQPEQVEQLAWVLLRRYGVVFRTVLAREASWLPPWFMLLRAYRRLEAQGLIRGGRFVEGFTGEQYALPEAVGALRAVRRRPLDGQLVSLSAADPLNLAGILTPGARISAAAANRVLLRDGVPVAAYVAGETRFLTAFDPAGEWAAHNALLRLRAGMQMRTPTQ